jgi:hypothetical protein
MEFLGVYGMDVEAVAPAGTLFVSFSQSLNVKPHYRNGPTWCCTSNGDGGVHCHMN